MTDPAIRASNLSKDYGDLVALRSVDLDVDRSQITLLTGPNGAGKTTFLKLVAGVIEPTDGELLVCGHAAGSIEARRAVAYVPDMPSLYGDISLLEQIEYTARAHGVEAWEERSAAYLEEFDMTEWGGSLTSGFSRGMKQKASLILAFVRPFEVLLADEPYAFLDKSAKEALTELLARTAGNGASVVVASHEWGFGLEAREVHLSDGQVISS